MTDPIQIAVKAIQLYAETHPRPTQVNIGQDAQMLDLSRDTVRKLIRNGVMSMNQCGLIPIEQVDLARSSRNAVVNWRK